MVDKRAGGMGLTVGRESFQRPRPRFNGATTVTNQGLAAGAAKFNRLEGCWYGDGGIYFNSTSGGDAKNGDAPGADGFRGGYGQVWCFHPVRQHPRLHHRPDTARPYLCHHRALAPRPL